MRALVTGGAGFIGSNLVDRLIADGHEVVVIDDESSVVNEKFHWNDAAENHKENICDFDAIRPLFEGVDVAFHLAARSRIQLAIKDPRDSVLVNAYGTCNILQSAREAGVDRVVYSSTSSAYGLTDPPHVESQEVDCLNPYSVSKVAGEKLCEMYTNLFGLKTVVFRYFNVYGERQSVDGAYSTVIGIFLKQSYDRKKLTITNDGEQRRDFTYVQDVVEANILASTSEKVGQGEVINIGRGNNYSVNEIAEIIGGETEFIGDRLEPYETLANNKKAKELLGWEPKVDIKEWLSS